MIRAVSGLGMGDGMDLGLEGRVTLVTGGSKGIGFGIARALAAEGAKVAVASRNREAIDAAAAEIGGQGFVFDSDDLDAIPGLLDDVEAALGPIDIYIANTGGPPPNQNPLAFSPEVIASEVDRSRWPAMSSCNSATLRSATANASAPAMNRRTNPVT